MRLLHVISGADLRARNQGLLRQATDRGVSETSIKPGDIIAFINQKRTSIAMVAVTEHGGLGVLGYWKSPSGRVPPEAIEFIPQAFGGEALDMNKAVRLGLEKLLSRKASRKKTRSRETIAGLKRQIQDSDVDAAAMVQRQKPTEDGHLGASFCQVVAKEVRLP